MSKSSEKPLFKEWWFWVIVVAVLLVIIVFFLSIYTPPSEQSSFKNSPHATSDSTPENKISSTSPQTKFSQDNEEPTNASRPSSASTSTSNSTSISCEVPSSTTTEERTTGKVSIPNGNKIALNNRDGKEQQYYEANVLAGLDEQTSEFEAVSKINNWLCETLIYEVGYVLPPEVLENGKAQCEGYALLFYAMCRNASIECNIVSGKTKDSDGQLINGHTWNQVKIGGTWYYIDVCWNDVDAAPNRYFLTEKLWGDHQTSYVSEYGTIYF